MMHTLSSLSTAGLTAITMFAASSLCASVFERPSQRDATRQLYTQAHSLGNTYAFPVRDGWTTLNVTDMQYKYRRSLPDPSHQGDADATDSDLDAQDVYALGKRTSRKDKHGNAKKAKAQHKKPKSKAKAKTKVSGKKAAGGAAGGSGALAIDKSTGGLGSVVGGALDKVGDALHGIGNPEPVTITWYTGHDLENPSCWAQSVWAPTDASFAAALTLEGWTSKPQCYKFLELCNGPKACIFVRVVDTCAGCARGSKHVDLTRAAFGSLADFDQGVLTVQMRPATDPIDAWFDDLWGPKAN